MREFDLTLIKKSMVDAVASMKTGDSCPNCNTRLGLMLGTTWHQAVCPNECREFIRYETRDPDNMAVSA